MNATRRVKRRRSKKNRHAAIPLVRGKWPPQLPPLSALEPFFFDEPEPPDCEDEYDPPGWPS